MSVWMIFRNMYPQKNNPLPGASGTLGETAAAGCSKF